MKNNFAVESLKGYANSIIMKKIYTSTISRRIVSGIFSKAIVMSIILVCITCFQSFASVQLNVTGTTSVASVNAGNQFIYTVDYQITSATADNGQSVVATIVLPNLVEPVDAINFSNSIVINGAHIATALYDAPSNTVTLNFVNPIATNTFGQFKVLLRFKNGVTPNNYDPNFITAIDANNNVNPGGATGPVFSNLSDVTALAQNNFSIAKTFVSGGVVNEVSNFNINISGNNAALGSLFLSSPTVIDTLPVGVVFLSATAFNGSNAPVYDALNRTITWTWPALVNSPATNLTYSSTATIKVKYTSPTYTATNAATNAASLQGTVPTTPLPTIAAIAVADTAHFVVLAAATNAICTGGFIRPSTTNIITNHILAGTTCNNFNNGWMNVGNTILDSLQLIYTVDKSINMNTIYVRPVFTGTTADSAKIDVSYSTNLNAAFTAMGSYQSMSIANGIISDNYTPALAVGEYITQVRFLVNGPIDLNAHQDLSYCGEARTAVQGAKDGTAIVEGTTYFPLTPGDDGTLVLNNSQGLYYYAGTPTAFSNCTGNAEILSARPIFSSSQKTVLNASSNFQILDIVHYQYHVELSGNLTASSVTVTDTLNNNLNYISGTSVLYIDGIVVGNINPVISFNVLTWNLGNLTTNHSYDIRFDVKIGAATPSSIIPNRVLLGTSTANALNTGLTNFVNINIAANGVIGNYVWNDLNGDGINNETASAGINGLKLYLLKDNGAGTFLIIDSATTANSGGNPGYYNFNVFNSGNYKVQFPVAAGGKFLTTQSVIAGVDNNSDADASTGLTNAFAIDVLASGVALINNTIDAGYKCGTLFATITGSGTFCALSSSLLTASAGFTTYQWNLNGVIIPGATNQTYSATVAGDYTVTVTNASGCITTSAIKTLTVLPGTSIPTITTGGATTFCSGNSVLLTSSAGSSYQWNFNGTPIPGATNQTYSANATGDYTVSVVNSNGCGSGTSVAVTATVILITSPVITAVGPVSFCNGGSVQLNATAGYTSYQWYKDAVLIAGATNTSYIATTTGNYTVAVTNSSGCVANSIATTITVNTPLAPFITAAGSTIICSGSNVQLSASSGYNAYQWYKDGVLIVGATNQAYTATVAGSYTAVGTLSGCISDQSTATVVTVGSTSATPTISAGGPTTFCTGSSVLLTSSAGSAYQWYFNGSPIPAATNQTFSANATGNYTVIVNSITGSCPSSASAGITVTAIVVTPATVTASGATTFCNGGTVQLNATAGYTTYQWYNSGTLIAGATNASYTATVSGNYVVTVSNLSGCSANSLATAVTVNTTSTPVINANTSTTICTGDSVVLSSNTAYTSYQWYKDGVLIPTAVNQIYVAKSSGTYTLIGVSNGCSSVVSASQIITVNTLPIVPSISAGSATTFCAGNSVTLNSSVANSYQWNLNGVAISGATNQNYSANTSGNYTVTISNINGCKATSAIIAVVVNTVVTPTITAGGSTIICTGNSVQLSSTGGYASYQWYIDGVIIAGATNQTYSANLSGNYTVIGTSAAGCVSSSSAITTVTTVAPPATPTITTSGNTTICAGNSIVLTSSPANSYQWYKNGVLVVGATTQNYSTNTSGNYSVIVSNVSGCNSPSSAITTVVVVSFTATISAGGPTTFCNGSSVVLSSTPASSYQWYVNSVLIPGATSQTYTVTTPGFYGLVAVNADGCNVVSNGIPVTVNVSPTPAITTSGTTSICAGSNVILNSTPGYVAYQWYKDGVLIAGATGQSYTANTSGDYTVKGTSLNGCISLASVATTVTVSPIPATPSISASGATILCAGETVILNSTAGASYQWYKNAALIVGEINPTYTVTSAGTYTVIVANAAGCKSSASNPVAVTYNSTIPTITPNAISFCTGGNALLTASAGLSYQWFFNGTAITGANSQIFSAILAGTYTISVTNSFGCTSTSAASIVTINSSPTPTITPGGATTVCLGSSLQLNGNSGYTTYQWYKDGVAIAGAASQIFTTSTAGSYTLVGTNSTGCASIASDATIVTVVSPPAIPVISAGGLPVLCNGGTVQLTSSAASSYQWYKNNVLIVGEINQTYAATSAGNYSVIVTNAAGCKSSVSNIISISLNSTTATVSPTSISFCTGSSAILTASPGIAYQWYKDGVAIAGATSQLISVILGGSYTVAVTNSFGCTSTSSASNVALNSSPIPTITPTGATTVCAGSTVQLGGNAGYTVYQWYKDGIAVAGAANQNLTVNSSGSYTLTGTNSTGCVSSASVPTIVTVVSVPSTPTITAGGSIALCNGGSVVLTSTSAANYQWYKNDTIIAGEITQTYTVTSAGKYTVVVTNPTGCKSIASNAIVVTYNSIIPTITASSVSFCTGGNAVLTSSSGTAYQWYFNGVLISGATNQTISVILGGSYTVAVTNGFGCTSTSLVTIVTVNSSPTPFITSAGLTTLCSGNSIQLSGSTGYISYQWYKDGIAIPGAASQNLTVNTSGSYTLIGTNNTGCSSTASAATVITVVASPVVPVIFTSGSPTKCAGDTVVLVASIGVDSNYQWYRNDTLIVGANAQTYAATTTGKYSVSVTNAGGCKSISASTIVNIITFKPIISSLTPTTFCIGGSVLLTASAGTNYSWYYNGVLVPLATSQNFFTLLAGSYAVQVTNNIGCTGISDTTKVVINSSPTPKVIVVDSVTTSCNGKGIKLAANLGYFNYQWYKDSVVIPGATSAIYTATTTGTYYVIGNIGISNICASTPSLPIKLGIGITPVTPVITATDTTIFCKGGSVTLVSTTSSGYQWYKDSVLIVGATNKNYVATTSGVYRVLAVSGGVCYSGFSNYIIVKVNSDTAKITAGGSTTICNGSNVILTASAGTSYQWYKDSVAIAVAVNQTYSATSAGNYAVSVLINGCPNISALTKITMKPNSAAPSIVLTRQPTICLGDSVPLIATPVFATYQWYKNGVLIPGAIKQIYEAKDSGSYTVIGTPADGCVSLPSSSIKLITLVPPAKPVLSSAGNPILCGAGTVIFATNSSFSNQWFMNGLPIAGATNFTYATSAEGTYTVVAIDSNGCISPLSNSIVLTKAINVGFTVNKDTQEVCGNKFIFTPINKTAGSTYKWYFGDGSFSVSDTGKKVYTTTGIYIVKQVVTGVAPDFCKDSTTRIVKIVNCTYAGISEQKTLKLYPNPNQGRFNVEFLSKVAKPVVLRIVGAETGAVLYSQNINAIQGINTIPLDFRNVQYFANGNYVVTVDGNNLHYIAQRFMIQR